MPPEFSKTNYLVATSSFKTGYLASIEKLGVLKSKLESTYKFEVEYVPYNTY